mgnify:CR=1 FL=1
MVVMVMFLLLASACTVLPTAQPAAQSTPTLTAAPSRTPTLTPTPAPTLTSSPTACSRATPGQVTREIFDSELLGYDYTVSVYTPPCYGFEGNVEYPVLYLLHGQSMDDTFWLSLGAAEIADRLIADGAAPFMMVMPREIKNYEAVPGSLYGDSIVTELIPWVEENYRVCAERECRAIGGISRGGGWAARLAVRNFELFGAFGGHSMSLMPGDWWQVRELREVHEPEEFPRIYIDRGEDDYLFKDIDFFEKTLTDYGVPHEFTVRPGAHNVEYWQAHVTEYIEWYAQGWE